MPDIPLLLEHYGRVAALCQRLELGCATKLIVIEDVKAWGRGDDDPRHHDRLKSLAMRTLGQSIQLFAESMDLPEWRTTLQPAIDARNELHHRFFIKHDIEDPSIDVAAAIARLHELEDAVGQANKLVWEILEPILDAWEQPADGA